MAHFTFDELLAKREQRKADKLAVTELNVPNSDMTLLVKKPTDAKLMRLYGQIAEANGGFEQMLAATDELLYHCCDQLQDEKLHEALGVADPLEIVPALFTVPERNLMGQQMMEFLGVFNGKEDVEEASAETPVKN